MISSPNPIERYGKGRKGEEKQERIREVRVEGAGNGNVALCNSCVLCYW